MENIFEYQKRIDLSSVKIVTNQFPKTLPTTLAPIAAVATLTQINNTVLFYGTVLKIGFASTLVINYSLSRYFAYKLENLKSLGYSQTSKIAEEILIN